MAQTAVLREPKDRIPSSPRSRGIAIKIVIILIGFLFFFSSPFVFSSLNEYLLTPVGTRTQIVPGRYVTINSWIYDADRKEMEVELLFENTLYDGKNSYSFESLTRGFQLKEHDVEMVLTSNDIIVVTIPGVSGPWNEVLLRVTVTETGESVPLYSNRLDIERGEITEKTEKDYRISSLTRRIENIKADIATCEAAISGCETRIENIRLSILDLEADKQYQTAEEVEETNHSIASLNAQITTEMKSIEDYNAQITEYNARIALTESEIKDIEEE